MPFLLESGLQRLQEPFIFECLEKTIEIHSTPENKRKTVGRWLLGEDIMLYFQPSILLVGNFNTKVEVHCFSVLQSAVLD